MSTRLVKWWTEEIYPTDAEDEIGIAGTKAVYLAADVETVLVPPFERLIQFAEDATMDWEDSRSVQVIAEAKQALASLKGQP